MFGRIGRRSPRSCVVLTPRLPVAFLFFNDDADFRGLHDQFGPLTCQGAHFADEPISELRHRLNVLRTADRFD